MAGFSGPEALSACAEIEGDASIEGLQIKPSRVSLEPMSPDNLSEHSAD